MRAWPVVDARLALPALLISLGVGIAIGSYVSPLVHPASPGAPATPGPALLEPTATPTRSPRLLVHVSGAVKQPGVYELQEGQRVRDALAAAGGTGDGADPNGLNLAAPLKDGQHLVVPSLTPTPAAVGTAAPSATKPLNLNTASEAELETLPGVGPVTAQRIVRYREESGGFTAVEQLRTLKLVNEATFAKLRDLVTVQ